MTVKTRTNINLRIRRRREISTVRHRSLTGGGGGGVGQIKKQIKRSSEEMQCTATRTPSFQCGAPSFDRQFRGDDVTETDRQTGTILL